jgi:endonuclease/exonuclease/phosphatase (EEP) superfamily protein YafD
MESSSGLDLGSMDIMVVDSMAGAITAAASMAVVPTLGAFTVVATAFVAADLYMKVSEVTVASTAVAASVVTEASMVAVVNFMEAAGLTAEVADSMAVVEATEAGTANFRES